LEIAGNVPKICVSGDAKNAFLLLILLSLAANLDQVKSKTYIYIYIAKHINSDSDFKYDEISFVLFLSLHNYLGRVIIYESRHLNEKA